MTTKPLPVLEPPVRYPLPSALLHTLRTPLNHILGYSEMLIEQAQEEGYKDLIPDLQLVRTAGKELLRLLNSSFHSHSESDRSDSNVVSGLEERSAPDGGVVPRWTGDPAPGSLLVVDDNEANRDVLSRRLRQLGYAVATAEDGGEALEMLRAAPYDLVLLDIMMPEVDGYEVLQRLKSDSGLRHLPVIMISALSETDAVARCIDMGADDYLPKPFNPTLLRARVGASLERKRAHDRETALFQELQQNYKRLQELEKLREDLTHMIVHDLRTPLTSLITGMQTLDLGGDLSESQREMAGIAIGGGETLLGMINDLLDVEKLESGTMQLEYTQLSAELVRSAISQVAPLVQSHALTLLQQIPADLPCFPGDENKLRRTLVNLLGNAIKFTPRGGTVTVEVCHRPETESLVFSVTDTGEGIPPEAFARIFEKFGQVESRRAGRTMSTGLGLAFCKLAVEAHGGQIEVESVLNQGSTFRFSLPLRPALAR